MFNFDPVPARAERVGIENALKVAERPSKFLPGATALVPYFLCPGCGAKHEQPVEGRTLACDCGLHMQPRLTHLMIWRNEHADA